MIEFIKRLFYKSQSDSYIHGTGDVLPRFGMVINNDKNSIDSNLKQIEIARQMGCKSIRLNFELEYYNEYKKHWMEYIPRALSHTMDVYAVISQASEFTHRKIYSKLNAQDGIKQFSYNVNKFIDEFKCYKLGLTPIILNNINVNYQWNLTLDEYMNVLSQIYPIFDKNGWRAIMGGLVGSLNPNTDICDQIERLMKLGLNDCTDGICFNWYQGNISQNTNILIRNLECFKKLGCNKPIHILEFGHFKSNQQKRVFDHFYKEFGKEYSMQNMFWYASNKAPAEFNIFDENLKPKNDIFRYLKTGLSK